MESSANNIRNFFERIKFINSLKPALPIVPPSPKVPPKVQETESEEIKLTKTTALKIIKFPQQDKPNIFEIKQLDNQLNKNALEELKFVLNGSNESKKKINLFQQQLEKEKSQKQKSLDMFKILMSQQMNEIYDQPLIAMINEHSLLSFGYQYVNQLNLEMSSEQNLLLTQDKQQIFEQHKQQGQDRSFNLERRFFNTDPQNQVLLAIFYGILELSVYNDDIQPRIFEILQTKLNFDGVQLYYSSEELGDLSKEIANMQIQIQYLIAQYLHITFLVLSQLSQNIHLEKQDPSNNSNYSKFNSIGTFLQKIINGNQGFHFCILYFMKMIIHTNQNQEKRFFFKEMKLDLDANIQILSKIFKVHILSSDTKNIPKDNYPKLFLKIDQQEQSQQIVSLVYNNNINPDIFDNNTFEHLIYKFNNIRNLNHNNQQQQSEQKDSIKNTSEITWQSPFNQNMWKTFSVVQQYQNSRDTWFNVQLNQTLQDQNLQINFLEQTRKASKFSRNIYDAKGNLRLIKRDQNNFFRALIFRLLEFCLNFKFIKPIYEICSISKNKISTKFSKEPSLYSDVIQYFRYFMANLVHLISVRRQQGKESSIDELVKLFNLDQNFENSAIVYIKFMLNEKYYEKYKSNLFNDIFSDDLTYLQNNINMHQPFLLLASQLIRQNITLIQQPDNFTIIETSNGLPDKQDSSHKLKLK